MPEKDKQADAVEQLFSVAVLVSAVGAASFIIVFPNIVHKITNVENELTEFMADYTVMSNTMWRNLQQQLQLFPEHLNLRRKKEAEQYGAESISNNFEILEKEMSTTISDTTGESIAMDEALKQNAMSKATTVRTTDGTISVITDMEIREPAVTNVESEKLTTDTAKVKTKKGKRKKKERILEINHCPAGPPGPPGILGPPGHNGFDGIPGKPGSDRKSYQSIFCEPCTVGPPGKAGYKGTRGSRGIRGPKGPAGSPGQHGDDGEKGPDGEIGPVGVPGKPGERGRKGNDGMSFGKGASGPKGKKGPPGLPGDEGLPGEIGEDGQQGDQGERGAPGEQGRPGTDGDNGERGPEGLSGEAGGYCLCPDFKKIDLSSKGKDKNLTESKRGQKNQEGNLQVHEFYRKKFPAVERQENENSNSSPISEEASSAENGSTEGSDSGKSDDSEKSETSRMNNFGSQSSKDILDSGKNPDVDLRIIKIQGPARGISSNLEVIQIENEENSIELGFQLKNQQTEKMGKSKHLLSKILEKEDEDTKKEKIGNKANLKVEKVRLDNEEANGGRKVHVGHGTESEDVKTDQMHEIEKLKRDDQVESEDDVNATISDNATKEKQVMNLPKNESDKTEIKIDSSEKSKQVLLKGTKGRKRHRKIKGQKEGTQKTSGAGNESKADRLTHIRNEKNMQEDMNDFAIKVSYLIPQRLPKSGHSNFAERLL